MNNRICEMLTKTRSEAGFSQNALAAAMGVSRKTINNWETGVTAPKVEDIIAWFEAIDIPIYPYMLKLSRPELENINANSSDQEIKDALISAIEDMDISNIRKNFFEMFGAHGTAPAGMGEVKTAYLHLPMDVKVGIAEIICTQFIICEAQGRLVQPDHVMPNIEALKKYIQSAKEAVCNGKTTYI